MMKTIDFNNGIMAKPINDNFNYLKQAIQQERLNIGGYGISYGLDITIDNLAAYFKAGHAIDKTGASYAISETILLCDPPDQQERIEEHEVLFDGTLFLKHAPYGALGTSETDVRNIRVVIDNVEIDVVSVYSNTIKINKDFAFRKAVVTYRSALPRIDSVVVDSNALKLIRGTSSESPSIRPTEEHFTVATFFINPFGAEVDNVFYAQLLRIQEENHLRNVYTNSNNELFLNGTKLNNLGFIHFEKPLNPTPNMLWYDEKTHQLYAYLANEWAAIDNRAMAPVSEYKLFTPEQTPTDLKTFLFHKTEDKHMHFMGGKNELKVIIDQYPLFIDQYEEITYATALKDESLRYLLPQFGYTYNETFDEIYDNTGIGFRLLDSLKTPSYVQAEVIHRVADAELHSRLQRSASFCHTGFVELDAYQMDFETHVPYRYGENQLQVMTPDKNLFEHFDYQEVGSEQGVLSQKVTLTRAFGYPQRIHYRITTNIYSYDHVATLLENIQLAAETLVAGKE